MCIRDSLVTKQLDDFGIAKHETAVPILRIPAIAFLYLLGKAEADGQNGKDVYKRQDKG